MKRTCLTLLAALMAFFALPVSAGAGEDGSSAPCDFPYTVQRGDTLSAIARGAFGTSNYWAILSRNPQIERRTDTLFTGERLIIPCLGGPNGQAPNREALEAQSGVIPSGKTKRRQSAKAPKAIKSAATTAAPPRARASTRGAAPDKAAKKIEIAKIAAAGKQARRFLTASGFPPFADESLADGGMIAALMARAFEISEGAAAPDVTFENDRQTHLTPLLTKGAFDIGFPWVIPACDMAGAKTTLRPDDAWMCENFQFSAPYFDVVVGVFRRRDDSPADAPGATAAGNTSCEPTDLPIPGAPLKADGDGTTIETCLTKLIAGEVDRVRADVFAAETALKRLNLMDQVEEIPSQSAVWTVHAVAAKSKPEAVALLARLDDALAKMKQSGEWLTIVRRYFDAG